MKHLKKLSQFFALTVFEYALYGATIVYQFPPAAKLLPFYLWCQIALGCILTMAVFVGKVFQTEKFSDDTGYKDYQENYGWLINTKALTSVFWSFAFASQSMYWFAAGVILEEFISCLLRSSILLLYEDS